MERVAIADSSSGEFLQKKSRRSRAVREPVATHRKHDGAVPSRRRSSVPVLLGRVNDGHPCRFDVGGAWCSTTTSREPPSSSTSAVDKVTARHYWGAADQGDVEAGEGEDEGVSRGDWQDGWQPEERWRV